MAGRCGSCNATSHRARNAGPEFPEVSATAIALPVFARNPMLAVCIDMLPSADFSKPPAEADEHETPIAKEFRRLALESMAEELKKPSEREHRYRYCPEARHKQKDNKQGDGSGDEGNAHHVTDPIHGMLMAASVFVNPLLPTFSSEHVISQYTIYSRGAATECSPGRKPGFS